MRVPEMLDQLFKEVRDGGDASNRVSHHLSPE
jgi:hypothetical protein